MNQKEILSVVIERKINGNVTMLSNSYGKACEKGYKDVMEIFDNIREKIRTQSQAETYVSFKKRLVKLDNKVLKLPFYYSDSNNFDDFIMRIIESEIDVKYEEFCDILSHEILREIQIQSILEDINNMDDILDIPRNMIINEEMDTRNCSGNCLSTSRIESILYNML